MTVGVLAVGAAPDVARAADLRIPLDTVIVAGVAEGERAELALVASDGLAGRSCAVSALHDASGDVHRGNDLVVTSGAASVDLADVERAQGATTGATATLALGDVIRIDLIMGPDESFGGDVDLELECDDGPPGTVAAGPSPRALTGTPSTTVAGASPTTVSAPSALPVTGPSSTTVQFVLSTLLVLTGYGLTVLARRPERS